MLTVRSRTDHDLDACMDVLQHVYDTSGYPVQGTSKARDFLSKGFIQNAWVAVHDDKVIGHVALSAPDDSDVSVALWRATYPEQPMIAVLGRLFVDPRHTRGGAATQLLQAVEEWSRQTNTRLVLFALDKDQAAMRLYRRQQWVEFGTVPYRYGQDKEMDAVCFASPLLV